MTDLTSLVDEYLGIWNDTDAASRRSRIEKLWAADAGYTDPLVAACGHDQIDTTIAAVQAQFPGLTFRRIGAVDAHHQQLRFTWGLGPDGQEPAEPAAIGFDVAVTAPDGRLQNVYGFLDRVPAA